MTPDERKISDLSLASWLALQGHALLRIEANGRDRGYFVFHDTPDIERDSMSFYSRKALVEPIAYAEQMRMLRGAVR